MPSTVAIPKSGLAQVNNLVSHRLKTEPQLEQSSTTPKGANTRWSTNSVGEKTTLQLKPICIAYSPESTDTPRANVGNTPGEQSIKPNPDKCGFGMNMAR